MPRRRGVVLVGLDGRIVARLPRFASYPSSNTPHDGLLHNLDWAGTLEQPRLVGPGDRYYWIDASRHALIPIPGQRVPLRGGAELVGHGCATEFRGLSVVRDGQVDGGPAFGDSGGPTLLGGSNVVVGIWGGWGGGVEFGNGDSWDVRLDTPTHRAFLGQYVTLP